MSKYTNLLNNLDQLELLKIKEHLDEYIDLINEKKKDIIDSLYELTNLEIEMKESKRVSNIIKFAGFPYLKELKDYDFSFQPSLNKEQILEFKNLRFIENKENILFVGSPGVGKTHLATAIGIEAAKNKKIAFFTNCNDLIANLKKAFSENRLDSKLKQYAKYKVLIIDEVGYLPIDQTGANLLFQLINKRYEKTSTIVTTNMTFGKWGEIFGDSLLANAILDRLLHHAYVFHINGKSYRTKDLIDFDSNSDQGGI